MDHEDALVTAADGRMLDVGINPETELVHLAVGSTTFVDLAPAAARQLADLLNAAAAEIHPS